MSGLLGSCRPQVLSNMKVSGVRFTARTRQRTIPVQLLKNVKGLGVRGEIVQVKPTHMMNWLQFHNRASFILPGQQPPIPVVDKTKQLKELERKQRQIIAEQNLQLKKNAEVVEKSTVKLEDLKNLTGLKFGE